MTNVIEESATMPAKEKSPLVGSIEKSKGTPFLGVEYSVLLPRERSECVEILLERFPKALAFPIHQHKECEQTYLFLEGEAEVNVAGQLHRLAKGGIVYIPRLTDHGVKNIGDSELVYIVVETYPDGYLPGESTWDSHINALKKRYDIAE
jgi:quercetin dioxygenase-like cupin family protein